MVSKFHGGMIGCIALLGLNYAFAVEGTQLLPLHVTSVLFAGVLGLFFYKRL